MRKILTIAGSDSCAGAGIQADIKTIQALGAYALSVITAVTAQNTRQVTAVQEIEALVIEKQLEAIFSDIRLDGIKIGMLGSAGTVQAVSNFLASFFQAGAFREKQLKNSLPLVVDPVMIAKSGDRLLEEEAVESLKKNLLPLASVITPNLMEAGALLGRDISSLEGMKEAARELLEFGCPWAIVKGGHLKGEPVDVLANKDSLYLLRGQRVDTACNHGTGCTFSAALATLMGQGFAVPAAAKRAKAYVEYCLQHGFAIGEGVGIPHHFAAQRPWEPEALKDGSDASIKEEV